MEIQNFPGISLKNISWESGANISEIFFNTQREIHISVWPCKILFIILNTMKYQTIFLLHRYNYFPCEQFKLATCCWMCSDLNSWNFFPVVCICGCKIIGYTYITTAHIPSAKYMSDDQFTFLFNWKDYYKMSDLKSQ